VAKLVDARDLKSLGLSRAGSIPAVRTKISFSLKSQENKMLGFEYWELVLIASGAMWGAWLFRKKKK
jgi:hypothetical protein